MRTLALVCWLALVGCEPGSIPAGPQLSVGADPPNVLMIVTDDQDAASLAYMPLTLAWMDGVTFTRAYSTTSLCCPGRVAILRGQYAHNHGVLTNVPPSGGWSRAQELGLESSTLATWLHDAGYRTGFVGKYLNGYLLDAAVPPGWDYWRVPENHYAPAVASFDGVSTEVSGYHTDLVTGWAADFIRDSVPGPWLLVVAYYAPHAPATPAARHAGMYAGLLAPRPPSFNVPKPAPATYRDHDFNPPVVAQIDALYPLRLESLQAVDEGVDALLALLDSLGALDETLVMFTSDNGYLNGEHSARGKNKHYEESIRVPLLVRGPGVRNNKTLAHLVALHDLAPTIADFAGVAVPSWVDGRSLRPPLTIAHHSLSAWRDYLLVENWSNDAALNRVHGVRGNSVMYAEWWNGGVERYSMIADPYQMANLGASPVWAARLATLAACAGATCTTAEGP